MLGQIRIGRRAPDRRGHDQHFRVAIAARDQPVRQPRFKMRRVARLQIISFARERQCEFAGQNINPFLAIVMIMLVAAARRRHLHSQWAGR